MVKRFVAVVASAAMASAMIPAVAFAADTQATASSYQVYGQRDAKYGTPPKGDESNAGMSFVISVDYGAPVTVSDAAAAVKSLNADGVLKLNGSTLATLPNATVKADGNKLIIDVPVAMAIMTGKVDTAVTTLDGVTVNGQAAQLPAISTQICTGLRFHVSKVVTGTATTPASTTITIDQSAVLRSMNHILWTSNGSSILEGVGSDQSTPAHHHAFYSFTLESSANAIVSGAQGKAALMDNYDVTSSGATVTITAKTAKAGEKLGVFNYDDAFLQGVAKSWSDHITNVAYPVEGQWVDVDLIGSKVTYNGKSYAGKDVSAAPLNFATYGMTRGTDYTVTYKGSTTKAGKVTATLTGQGIYKGTKTITYKIMPTKGKITSLKGSKGKFTAKWSDTGATKFKVSYRVKGASKWSTKTATKRSIAVKGLKSKKTYQVKVTSVTTAGNTTTSVKTVKTK